MNTHIALLLFGAVLMLTAIVGGGFEIHQLKIPKVERVPRILAGIGGAFFLILGVTIGDGRESRGGEQVPRLLASAQATGQIARPIQFIIFDELESDHILSGQSEQALIRIDGVPIGTLTVNEHFPKSELVVNVANEGQHSFAIEATAVLPINNRLAEVNCYGTGMINVASGDRFLFEARYDPRGGPCLAWIERR